MSHTMKLPALAAATLIALAVAGAAHAESSASSAASNSVSASVGSVSTSFNASSDASSPGRPVKAGAYRVIDMAQATGREGFVQLTLRAEAGAAGSAADEPASAQDAILFLPLATVANAALAVGQVIQAHARPYGLELTRQGAAGERAGETFFLVVADEVYRELQTRVVKL